MVGIRKPQAVILGIDNAKTNHGAVYYCRECGKTTLPCHHIDGFMKSQIRDKEAARRRKFAAGEKELLDTMRRL